MKDMTTIDAYSVKPKSNNNIILFIIFKPFYYLFRWTIFGLSKEFYFVNFVKCSVLTGSIILFVHYKYGITHWDGVYLIAMNNIIYPYAKYLFPNKGRFRNYADEGIMVTMTRQEYDRSIMISTVVPYVFAFIFAPMGLMTLFFDHLRRK